MADQAITALPKKTNSGTNKIAATDYLLGIDSAEGYQMLIKDLGDYIIQNVQSSLAGSNQTLAAALSALNSKLLSTVGTAIPDNVDLNTYLDIGKYYLSNSSSAQTLSHCPCNASFSLYVVIEALVGRAQIIITNEVVPVIYIRLRNAAGEWKPWQAINDLHITHPAITDVLTPAEDVSIVSSYVSVQNKLMILDCNFTQTSATKTNRFTFKNGYRPIGSNTNIAPIFMYSNNAVSNTVLFVNTSTLTMFGANPVAGQGYYFRLTCFIE